MALNPKQQAFCLEYAKTGNATRSVINAGYKVTSEASASTRGSLLLRNVKIKARLAEIAQAAKNTAIADIQEMQERLTAIIRQEMQEEVIVNESDGVGGVTAKTMKKTASIRDIINAVNSLGKMQGAFVERMDITGAVPVVIDGRGGLED